MLSPCRESCRLYIYAADYFRHCYLRHAGFYAASCYIYFILQAIRLVYHAEIRFHDTLLLFFWHFFMPWYADARRHRVAFTSFVHYIYSIFISFHYADAYCFANIIICWLYYIYLRHWYALLHCLYLIRLLVSCIASGLRLLLSLLRNITFIYALCFDFIFAIWCLSSRHYATPSFSFIFHHFSFTYAYVYTWYFSSSSCVLFSLSYFDAADMLMIIVLCCCFSISGH